MAPREGGPVRHIDTLQTLAIGSALILAIGTTACASEESEPATVQATTSTEASEGTADETSPAAEEEEEDEETSEAETE